MTTTPMPLPTLAELQLAPDQALKDDKFNLLLNQPPPAAWVKKTPYFNEPQVFAY